MAIGGILSGIGSIYSGYQTSKASKAALKQQQANIAEGKAAVAKGYKEVDDYLDAYKRKLDGRKVTNAQDLDEYRRLISGYNPNDYVAKRGNFDRGAYDVEDYIADNRDQVVKATADAVQRTAAGAGIGRGTGAAMDIAAAVADRDESLMDKAYQRMKDDRDFDYTEFQNQYAANQAALDKLQQGYSNRVQMLGGAIQSDNAAEDDYIADVIAARTGRTNATVNLLT